MLQTKPEVVQEAKKEQKERKIVKMKEKGDSEPQQTKIHKPKKPIEPKKIPEVGDQEIPVVKQIKARPKLADLFKDPPTQNDQNVENKEVCKKYENIFPRFH